jgi:fumarate reductase flavoprotein subunit
MSSDQNSKKEISRRNFIKGAAVVAGGGILASCAPQLAATPTTAAAPTASAPVTPGVVNAATVAAQKWEFEIPPAPIADSQITNTVTTEIVVIGAGTAGLVLANSALENGAKVVVIAASKGNISRGGSNHAMNSKVMQKSGYPIPDTDTLLRRELMNAGFNVDQAKWWKFGKNSEEAMNWLIDKMEAAGFKTVLEIGATEPNNGPMTMPIGSHSWIGKDITTSGTGQQLVVDQLATLAKAAGVQIFYQTVAEQLVRENNNTGRVTAVIAKGADGKYTKYVGTKAIVMAMGDFSADKEMMAKYCPVGLPTLDSTGDQGYDTGMKIGGLYKGDGQKMGLWIGAAWQKTVPNCPMILGGPGPGPAPYSAHPGLVVNKNGIRYGNEDCTFAFAAFSQLHQPEMKSYAIWGTNFAQAAAPWVIQGQVWGDPPKPVADVIVGWETSVKNKAYVKADTVEGVISALGLPADVTKATVDRYNTLAKNGVDEDFLKRKELLIPVDTGPFYGAASTKPVFLTVLGGLRTNINMQVCDANDQPIPGLYNLGTMVGDYFNNIYNFIVEGNNLGANCVTFGYTTGREIAKGT